MEQLFRLKISKSEYPFGVYVSEQKTANFATMSVGLPYPWFRL